MKLDIKHWAMLQAIEEAGTLRQAADVLGITQSALSHRLSEAERRLGGALFAREGRRLRATPAGQAMTQASMQALPALQRAETDFEQISQHATSIVRLGIAAYSCFHWLPEFMQFATLKAPSIQRDCEVVCIKVIAGEIKIQQARELLTLEENVIREQISMYHAIW